MALFALLIPTIALTFTSCAVKSGDPLAYQARASKISAVLMSETGTFSVVVTHDGAAGRECSIEFTAPETIAGVTVQMVGDVVTVSSGDAALPMTAQAARRFLDIAKLFRLDGGAISSVEQDQGGKSVTVTVAGGMICGDGSACDVLVRFDGGASVPKMIKTADGSIELTILDCVFTDEASESESAE